MAVASWERQENYSCRLVQKHAALCWATDTIEDAPYRKLLIRHRASSEPSDWDLNPFWRCKMTCRGCQILAPCVFPIENISQPHTLKPASFPPLLRSPHPENKHNFHRHGPKNLLPPPDRHRSRPHLHRRKDLLARLRRPNS